MKTFYTIIFFLLAIPLQLLSQVLPKEGSMLHYRIIGFRFQSSQGANNYKLEIATGHYNTEDSFKSNIAISIPAKANKMIAEVPSFGRQYTWRVLYYQDRNAIASSAFYHFQTMTSPYVDTSIIRLNIIDTAKAHKGAFVFMDASRALYNMAGTPVWYLADVDSSGIPPIDIKSTPQGTITFLVKDRAYEVNYNGDVSWKAPNNGKVSGDSIEYYHHEFTRLPNGHYMILGQEFLPWQQKNASQGNNNNPALGNKVMFGTIIEYDKRGNVVWSWRSSKYFMSSDLNNYTLPHRFQKIDVHENAFYFDEKTKTILVSFKNISRIIKIQYPSGKVLAVYGEIYKQGIPENGNGLFCDQHSCRTSEKGYLYLYDNNACTAGAVPKIMILKEPAGMKDTLETVWEYECPRKGLKINDRSPVHSSTGGNIIELPDHSMFVSMSSPHGKVFIVNMEKEILWSAVLERKDTGKNIWVPAIQYRASIIENRQQLESMIWAAEISKQ